MNPVVDALMVLKVLFALAVVLVVAILVVRFGLPRLLRIRSSSRRRIKVLEVFPLDRQTRLILFRVGDRFYLCASSPEGMVRIDRWRRKRIRGIRVLKEDEQTAFKRYLKTKPQKEVP